MAVNTESLDDGKYTTLSSISVVASRATVQAQDITATSALSVGGAVTMQGAQTFNSTLSVAGAVTMQSTAQVRSSLTAIGWLYAGVFISSATTAQSGATSRISQQGQIYFSVLSLTSNGGEIGFRSGNTVYRFASDLVG